VVVWGVFFSFFFLFFSGRRDFWRSKVLVLKHIWIRNAQHINFSYKYSFKKSVGFFFPTLCEDFGELVISLPWWGRRVTEGAGMDLNQAKGWPGRVRTHLHCFANSPQSWPGSSFPSISVLVLPCWKGISDASLFGCFVGRNLFSHHDGFFNCEILTIHFLKNLGHNPL